MKKLYYSFLLVALCAISLSSCKKAGFSEVVLDSWQPDVAIPLASSEISMIDLLEEYGENTTRTRPDALIEMVYSGEEFYYEDEDLPYWRGIPDIPVLMYDTSVFFPYHFAPPLRIDYIDFVGGLLINYVESSEPDDIDVTLTFPTMVQNGDTFKYSFFLPYGGSPVVYQDSVDMAGARLNIGVDSVPMEYEAFRRSDGKKILLDRYVVGFAGWDHSLVVGYMGPDSLASDRDTIHITVFDRFRNGSIYVEEPRVAIYVESSFGFPIEIGSTVMDFYSYQSGVLPLVSPLQNGTLFNYPGINAIGEVRNTNLIFDTNNSNIDQILPSAPYELDYQMYAVSNPNEDTSIVGFLTSDAFFRVNTEVIIPFHGRIDGFKSEDTVAATFDKISDFDNVRYANFKLVTENEFPLDIEVQLFMLDAANNPLDSLFTTLEQRVMNSPSITPNGGTAGIAKTTRYMKFDGERLDNIRNMKKVAIRSQFYTASNSQISVKVFEEYRAKIGLGVIAGLDIN